MCRVILVPLDGNPASIDVLRLFISKAALSFAGHPVIERFFVLLQPLVFFELDNLLGDEVDSPSRIVDDGSVEQIMVFGQGQVFLELFSVLFKLVLEDLLGDHLALSYFLLLCGDEPVVDERDSP